MKRFILILLAMLLLTGCGAQEVKDVKLDSSFVIVCEEAGMQAALSLQTTIKQKCAMELEIVSQAPKDARTITVAVDGSLKEGQYRTRIVGGNVAIEAQSSLALVMAMRNIREIWVADDGVLPLTEKLCADLSGSIDLKNAPFLVLTQNIRYADDEGGNMVVQRAPRFLKLVQEYLPDIICLQEDNSIWSGITDKMLLENYGAAGTFSGGKDSTTGNRQAIFFRADRYELVEEGAVWLSDTPDVPMSKLEDSKSCRHCTWAVLKDNLTGKELFVCNTHLDTRSDEVRLAQLEILYTQLSSYMEKYPTIFCGDFNARPDSGVYARVAENMSDPHVTAAVKLSSGDATYTDYGRSDDPRRLDYLFYNDRLTANRYRVMTDQYDGYISDHFGVTTEYSFTP